MERSTTLIGQVESVKGGTVTVQLRAGPAVVMVDGHSYRVGQIGAFIRIPLGYTQLYAVCTLVGAAAGKEVDDQPTAGPPSYRWLTAVLFGESIGGVFERGVSQYPTFEDEVHLVTPRDMAVIYRSIKEEGAITVGRIASATGIPGKLELGPLVARHSAIFGSTGSGKSNLVSVLIDAIATQGFPRARILVIDPHGEYSSAVGTHGKVFRVNPDKAQGEEDLVIPFWALPWDELQGIILGSLPPAAEAAVRDTVAEMKAEGMEGLAGAPDPGLVTADSPLPFSLKKLWFDLDDYERRTFQDSQNNNVSDRLEDGDPERLIPNRYPPPGHGTTPPFVHKTPRRIQKQLELMQSRLRDSRFRFLIEPGESHTPDLIGKVEADLDALVAAWVGHDRPLTILDVSGLPSEVLATVVGTLIRIVYDMLFWALDLPISGRSQPLLIVLEEAHVFLPADRESAAHRTINRIAREGRKYGVGLCVVTQRPGEIDSTVLSQCGTMISLRLTNQRDRSAVESALPDDLGALGGMLPALRTGEGIIIGEAMPIPSRMRFTRSPIRPRGDDPEMPDAWLGDRPDIANYSAALANWRRQMRVAEIGENNDDT